MPEYQSDFDRIGEMGAEPTALTGQGETETALSGMREAQAKMVAGQKDQLPFQLPPGVGKVEISKDGLSFKGVDPRVFEGLIDSKKRLDEIMGAFHSEASRLQEQETRARQQPWQQLATTLSANLAQAKDMPGWVQGLGRTAAQLNPTADELMMRKLGVLGQEAGMAEKSAALEASQHRERRLIESAQAAQTAKTFHELSTAAQKGELTDVSLASQVLQNEGHPKEKADAQAKALVGISQEKKALIDAAEAAKSKVARESLLEGARRADERTAVLLKGLALKASDKSESDKAIEEAAKSLAAGDLSSIRDISSFRGAERVKIYARAKELNPSFSVAETKRKIDMEQSFTVGKDGIALQSFGTFLEHAGEVTEALKGIYQSGSPAFNKPMNWWLKNMAGSPEYQRLLVSLEPVGKEFESFLLNQRALYVDDRKRIEVLLSDNSSPAQILSALNQMGKTAKDRYTEMSHRYKRVMKHDLENPFGEEAIAGAAKIGIELPRNTGPTSGKFAAGFEDYLKTLPPGKKAKDPSTNKWYTIQNGQIIEAP